MGKSYSELTSRGQSLYSVCWNHSDQEQLFVYLPLNSQECAFIEICSDTMDLSYDYLEREKSSVEDMEEYLQFLEESFDVSMTNLGNPHDKETYLSLKKEWLQPNLNTDVLQSEVFHAIQLTYTLYGVLEQINHLSMENGDVMDVYGLNQQLIGQDRLKVSSNNETYVMLPTYYENANTLEEERMTVEELRGYLFEIIVNEGYEMRWHHTFSDNKTTNISLKKVLQDVRKNKKKAI